MYFQFSCSHCGKNLKVSEENAGRKVRCPYCHHATVVEAPAAPPRTPDVTQLFDPNLPPTLKQQGEETKERASAPSQPSASGDDSFGTDINLLRSVSIGTAISVGFYLVAVLPFYKLYFGELFLQRGWVPFALVFLFGWSAAILYLKSRKLARQKDSMLFDLLPNDLSERITRRTLDKFVTHIRELPAKANESFLINRVLRGLEHFRVLDNSSEVANRLDTQSEIDAQSVDSSYTIIKVFIWAIPILGFIGTVIGISAAVGGFSGSMDSAQDISVLKESLGNVTGGLATAFDTTLVALVMSLLVMFPTSSMQKAEEDLLNWVDEYCNENLLRRLHGGDGPDSASVAGIDQKAIRKAIDRAMTAHHAELQAWTKKLESVGDTLTKQVTAAFNDVDAKLQERQEKRMLQFNKAVATMTAKQTDAAKQIDLANEKLVALQRDQTAHLQTVSEGSAAMQQQVAASMTNAASSLNAYFASLQQGLVSLNGVLGQLGEKQVVVDVNSILPVRRGWFGRRKRR